MRRREEAGFRHWHNCTNETEFWLSLLTPVSTFKKTCHACEEEGGKDQEGSYSHT